MYQILEIKALKSFSYKTGCVWVYEKDFQVRTSSQLTVIIQIEDAKRNRLSSTKLKKKKRKLKALILLWSLQKRNSNNVDCIFLSCHVRV